MNLVGKDPNGGKYDLNFKMVSRIVLGRRWARDKRMAASSPHRSQKAWGMKPVQRSICYLD